MIRMSLRQFRIQALVAAILLVLAATYLIHLGGSIRAVRDPSQLPSQYGQTMLFLAAGFGLVPALIGAFFRCCTYPPTGPAPDRGCAAAARRLLPRTSSALTSPGRWPVSR